MSDLKKAIKRIRKKLIPTVMAFFTAMSVTGTGGITPVSASSNGLDSVTITEGNQYPYKDAEPIMVQDGWGTVRRTVVGNNGEKGYAFCLEPIAENAPNGTQSVVPLSDFTSFPEKDAAKIMYYGWQMIDDPKYQALFPKTTYDGEPWDYAHYFVCVHQMLAYKCLTNAYDSSKYSQHTVHVSKDRSDWFWGLYNSTIPKLLALPDVPNNTIRVFAIAGWTNHQWLLGYTNIPQPEKGNISITKVSDSSKTNGNSAYSLSGAVYGIYSDSGCAKKVGQMTTGADGTAKSADLNVGTYYVKEITASKGFGLDTKVYTAAVKSKTITKVTSTEPHYEGSIDLVKKSSNTSISNTSSMYSLAGAEYVIYSDKACTKAVKTLKTDANGKASSGTIPLGSYWIKETKPSPGYLLDEEVYPVNVNKTAAVNVTVNEEPGCEHLGIQLEKVSKDEVENPAPLDGAQFEIKFYAGYYDTAEELPAEADRTWTIETKEENGSYIARLDEEHYVEGDDFYYDNDQVAIPLGTISIQETVAPKGYELKNGTLDGEPVSSEDGAVILKKIELSESKESADLIGGNEYSVEDGTVRGEFIASKVDAETGLSVGQGDGTLANAEYELINANEYDVMVNDSVIEPDEVVLTFKTNEKGEYTSPDSLLPYGKYIIREVTPSKGYLVDGAVNEYEFTISEDGGKVDLTGKLTEKPIRGGFTFRKTDTMTGTRAQGEGDLAGEFALCNRSEHAVSVDEKSFEPGAVIMTFETDKEGFYESARKLLPYGTYEIVETKAPKGYKSEGVTSYEFKIEEDDQMVDLTQSIKNEPITGQFEIHKNIYSQTESSIGRPEEGVEFTAVLKSYVDHYGSVEEAIKHKDEYTDNEWDVITTDAKGHATSKKLVYGTYVVKQTNQPDEEVNPLDETFEFIVSDADQEMKVYEISNVPKTYKVRITKVDDETGEEITLNSASFQITNKETSEVVAMKVGLLAKDTFKTVSKNGGFIQGFSVYYDGAEKPGVVITPLALDAGEYIITETEVPNGFLALEDVIETEVRKSCVAEGDIDSDGEMFINIIARNKRPHGELTVHKELQPFDADLSLVEKNDFSGIQVTLFAKEDIINPINGDVITAKGEAYGSYFLDKDGNLSVSDIPMGHYVLKETKVPAGMIASEEEYDVNFEQKDTTTEVYPITLTIKNETTKVSISKTDITGTKEIPGAELVVKDGETEIARWSSDEHPNYQIEGLEAGKTYTLTELTAPNGFVKAETIEFTVNADGSVTPVAMKDKQVKISKQDIAGEELPGAEMAIYLKDEYEEKGTKAEPVDSWTSEEAPHYADNLEEGKTYILHENTAPVGYAIAQDIEFTVVGENAEGVKFDDEYIMTDKRVTVSKVDIGDKEIPGAEIVVYDKNGEIVDSWTSTEEPHAISGLKVGETYILHEDTAPAGYGKASDFEFTVNDDYTIDQHEKMVDQMVFITKVNPEEEYQPGVQMKVVDEKGDTVFSWTTLDISLTAEEKAIVDRDHKYSKEIGSGIRMEAYPFGDEAGKYLVRYFAAEDGSYETYMLDENGAVWTAASNLIEGEKYSIVEVKPADGYTTAVPIPFEFTEDGRNPFVMMVDKKVEFYKKDALGEEVPGATVQVIDSEGNVVDEWVSTEEPHAIQNLEVGKTYTFHEEGAPDGFYYAEDAEFTVTDDGINQTEEMIDAAIVYQIEKVDDKGRPVAGVKLRLTDITDAENPEVVRFSDEQDKDGNWITTDKPVVLERVLKAGHKYRLDEIEHTVAVFPAASIEFTVDKYGNSEPITISMIDVRVGISILKVDAEGKALEGAKLSILDKDGKVVHSWTTSKDDAKGHNVTEFVKGGEKYVLHEDEAPFGYAKFEDIEFTATGTDDMPQLVMAVDKLNNFYVAVTKVDKSNHSKLLKGAEITIFTADGKIAKDRNGKNAVGITDGNGSIVFNMLYSEKGYYAMETNAPTGYKLSKEKYNVTLSKDYNFAKDNPIKIVVEDEPKFIEKVKTGVGGAPLAAAGIGAAALGGLAFIFLRKKKDEEKA